MNKIFVALLGSLLLLGAGLIAQNTSQKIDPFYLERLQSGEQAFLVGNYETAIDEMKIALFGLGGEKNLKAKAYVYLGLSYYYLNNRNEATTSLKDAKNLLSMEVLRSLITNETVWFSLNKVLFDLNLLEVESQKGPETVVQSRDPNFAKNLEQQIKSNPRNASLYYKLYDYHKGNNNTNEAKKTLENLINKNPNEAKAYYLLGRMEYRQRDLKSAEKNLNRVFTLQNIVSVEDYVLLEAKAYQILTVYLRGDRTRSYRMSAERVNRFTEDKIRFLDLEEQDRRIFMGIVGSEQVQAEIARLAGQVEGAATVREEGQEAGQQVGERTEQAVEQVSGQGKAQAVPTQAGGVEGTPSRELKAGDLVPLDQVDIQPVLIKRVDPKYPGTAQALAIEGNVVINVMISEAGDVVEVVIVEGLPGGLNEETAKAVRQWKYKPAVKDGVNVKVWKQITITYKRR